MAETPMAEARTAKAGFAEVVLVCAKCAKRQGVDRKRLGRALKRAAGRPEGEGALRPKARREDHKVKVVETGCLGPCPKRMLTVATAASLARGRVVLLDPALDALSPQALSLGSLAPKSLALRTFVPKSFALGALRLDTPALSAPALPVPAAPDADG